MIDKNKFAEIKQLVENYNARLLIVTKNQNEKDILEFYKLGQRAFGENKVQILMERYKNLPKDIEWHMIGHLQKNKIKYIIDWIYCIQSVDSFSLAFELNIAARTCRRLLPVLLEIKIAEEFTKYGFSGEHILKSIRQEPWDQLSNLKISGVMGMASFTENPLKIRSEFTNLKIIFDQIQKELKINRDFTSVSMGMSGDYQIALESGSTMIRIGSLLFS